VVFTWRMVPEVVQPFWAALQCGEFSTGAAEEVGTYRKKGPRWMVAEGDVRPRRGTASRRCSRAPWFARNSGMSHPAAAASSRSDPLAASSGC
jgi:hypothetical protein